MWNSWRLGERETSPTRISTTTIAAIQKMSARVVEESVRALLICIALPMAVRRLWVVAISEAKVIRTPSIQYAVISRPTPRDHLNMGWFLCSPGHSIALEADLKTGPYKVDDAVYEVWEYILQITPLTLRWV